MTTNDYILKLYGYLRLCYKISLVTLHWGFSSIPALYLRWPLEAGREKVVCTICAITVRKIKQVVLVLTYVLFTG